MSYYETSCGAWQNEGARTHIGPMTFPCEEEQAKMDEIDQRVYELHSFEDFDV